jgi:hypothetical protein
MKITHIVQDSNHVDLKSFGSQTEALVYYAMLIKKGFTVYYVVKQ